MKQETNQSVENALQLLDCFADTEEMGVSEIARTIGIGKASASRLVNSLKKYGYLQQNPQNQKYRLGLKMMFLGRLIQERNEIIMLTNPSMEKISQRYQVSAHLAVLQNNKCCIIHKVVGGIFVNMSSRVGSMMDAYCMATGKCLLAYSGAQNINTYLETEKLVAYTEATITNGKKLRTELEKIRDQGFAIDHEESNIGLSCVAVPIFDPSGNILAALSLSGQSKIIGDHQDDIVHDLRNIAQIIKTKL